MKRNIVLSMLLVVSLPVVPYSATLFGMLQKKVIII